MAKVFEKMTDVIKSGVDSLKTLKEDKAQYKKFIARVDALPESYRFAYKKISDYMWANYAGFNGYDMLSILEDVLDLFESAAARGESVADLTGNDPAAFCDDLLKNVPNVREKAADKLNRQIAGYK